MIISTKFSIAQGGDNKWGGKDNVMRRKGVA